MNWDQVEGSWKQIKGGVMQIWGMITRDEFGRMMGKSARTDGRIQKSCGVNRARSEKQLAAWVLEHRLSLRAGKH